MEKNYTYLRRHEITYEWVIKDFSDYLDLYDNETQDNALFSSNFSADVKDKDRFHIAMEFSQYTISCFLCWNKYNKPIKMKYHLYILDEKKQKYKEIVESKAISNSNHNTYGSLSVVSRNNHTVHVARCFASSRITSEKKDLLIASRKLFPHNNLIVVCNLIVFEQPVNISPIYTRKPHTSITNHFKELLESQSGSDVTFEINSQEFKAHKSILIARSPVFRAMFENDMIEKNTNKATIVDISPAIFKLMLKFIYADKLEDCLTEHDAILLLKAAAKYQLEGLEAICEERLFNLLTVKNVMNFLLIAENHNFIQLIHSIEDYIKAHEKEILDSIDSEHFLMNPHHANLFFRN